jgi:probable F420-dependent oxidoreductase
VRVDVVLPNTGDYAVQAVHGAAQMEALGFEGLWLTDHVLGMAGFTVYGDYWLEILTTLAHIAGATKKIRLGTGVLIAPLRDAVLTAKILSTIDVLSGGRLDLGIGTGWLRREFNALGRADLYDDRGAATDEALEVFMTCWKGGEFSHEGRWSNSSKIRFEPVPVQKPRPPFWIGSRGVEGRPLRRAAKYADFWHPTGLTPEQLREGGEKLDAMAGRPIARTIRMRPPADPSETRDLLRQYRDVGCVQAALDFSEAKSFAEFVGRAEAVLAEPL